MSNRILWSLKGFVGKNEIKEEQTKQGKKWEKYIKVTLSGSKIQSNG